MTDIPVNNKLNAPHEGKQSRLHGLISARTKIFAGENVTVEASSELWNAQWWGLSESNFFTELSTNVQKECLSACNDSILNEAYFIEKSGLAYSAKMVLLSESTDIAQLYALIGADEARHLAWIEPFVQATAKLSPKGEFLSFLSHLIENVSPNLLIFLVQIILEGWGLDHYRRLVDGCQSQALAAVFAAILKDEALHHKSGTLLFDAKKLSRAELELMKEALQTYVAMVRVGPITALSCISNFCCDLNFAQVEDLITALKHQSESTRKLKLLKQLMTQPGVESYILEMELNGDFTPLSDRDVADYFLKSLS